MGFKPGIYAFGLGYESDLCSFVLDKTEHDFSTTYYTFHFEIVRKRARSNIRFCRNVITGTFPMSLGRLFWPLNVIFYSHWWTAKTGHALRAGIQVGDSLVCWDGKEWGKQNKRRGLWSLMRGSTLPVFVEDWWDEGRTTPPHPLRTVEAVGMDAEMLGWARNASGPYPSGGKTAPWTAVEIQPNPHRLQPRTESPVFELTCAGFLHVAVVVAAAACGSCRHMVEVSAKWTPDPEWTVGAVDKPMDRLLQSNCVFPGNWPSSGGKWACRNRMRGRRWAQAEASDDACLERDAAALVSAAGEQANGAFVWENDAVGLGNGAAK